MNQRVSLEQFAKRTPVKKTGTPCWACTIKEAKEINDARKSGTQISVIKRWLVEVCGYTNDEATRNKLTHHFSVSRHHER